MFDVIGEKPRWELIYDSLAGLDVGDVVTYEQLAAAIGVDDFEPYRSSWYKAANRFGEDNQRAFRAVNGVGYRVVDAIEHADIAKAHHRKSKRQLRKGRAVLRNADRSRLSTEDSKRFDDMQATIGRHEDLIRRLDVRQERTEKAVAAAAKKHDVTDARIAKLEAALAKLDQP
jgi:alkylated DNA nucleotide flippase Atl1